MITTAEILKTKILYTIQTLYAIQSNFSRYFYTWIGIHANCVRIAKHNRCSRIGLSPCCRKINHENNTNKPTGDQSRSQGTEPVTRIKLYQLFMIEVIRVTVRFRSSLEQLAKPFSKEYMCVLCFKKF